MARKFIITEKKFIMGNVELHMDLLPRDRQPAHTFGIRPKVVKEEEKVLGGGRWDVNNEKKILYLWGASTDYGYAEPEQILKTINGPDTWISRSLENYKVMHSSIISNNLPELDTFTDLTTIEPY